MTKITTEKNLADSWYDTEHYPSMEVYDALIHLGSITSTIVEIFRVRRKKEPYEITSEERELLDKAFEKFESGYSVIMEYGMLEDSNKKYKRTKEDAQKDIHYAIDWTTQLKQSSLISDEELKASSPTLHKLIQEPKKHAIPVQKLTLGQKIGSFLLKRALKNE